MEVLAIFAIIALCLIALLHFYWAIGGQFGVEAAIPTYEGKRLINPGIFATVVVGLALFGFAFIVYMLYVCDLSTSSYREYIVMCGWILSGVFTLRGIGEFNAVGLFKKIKTSKFAYYDTRYYTPFAFFMGVIFAVLTYQA